MHLKLAPQCCCSNSGFINPIFGGCYTGTVQGWYTYLVAGAASYKVPVDRTGTQYVTRVLGYDYSKNCLILAMYTTFAQIPGGESGTLGAVYEYDITKAGLSTAWTKILDVAALRTMLTTETTNFHGSPWSGLESDNPTLGLLRYLLRYDWLTEKFYGYIHTPSSTNNIISVWSADKDGTGFAYHDIPFSSSIANSGFGYSGRANVQDVPPHSSGGSYPDCTIIATENNANFAYFHSIGSGVMDPNTFAQLGEDYYDIVFRQQIQRLTVRGNAANGDTRTFVNNMIEPNHAFWKNGTLHYDFEDLSHNNWSTSSTATDIGNNHLGRVDTVLEDRFGIVWCPFPYSDYRWGAFVNYPIGVPEAGLPGMFFRAQNKMYYAEGGEAAEFTGKTPAGVNLVSNSFMSFSWEPSLNKFYVLYPHSDSKTWEVDILNPPFNGQVINGAAMVGETNFWSGSPGYISYSIPKLY